MSKRVRYDAAVIGGGPAGLAAAISIARRGGRVALFDARSPGKATERRIETLQTP
jgi:2-polyprenyl-6-methoxyphenol hydroxylase-like FAD-dependent oxidoreductase